MSREFTRGRFRWRRLILIPLGVILFLVAGVYMGWWGRGPSASERWMAERRAGGERFTLAELGLDRRPAYASPVMDFVDGMGGKLKRFQNPSGPRESYRAFGSGGRRLVLWRESQMISVSGFRAPWDLMERQLGEIEPQLVVLRGVVEKRVEDPGGSYDHSVVLRMNFVAWRMAAQVLADAFVLEMHRGRTDAAMADLKALLQLAGQHRDEPLLVTQMLRVASVRLATEMVWQALQWEGWSVSQLALIREQLERLELLGCYVRAIEFERAMGVQYFEQHRTRAWDSGVVAGGGWAGHIQWLAWRRFAYEDDLLFFLQSHQAALERARSIESGDAAAVVLHRGLTNLEPADVRSQGIVARWLRLPVLSNIVSVRYSGAVRAVVEAETWRRMAIMALELERYRKVSGEWPPSFSALPPVDGGELWRVDPLSGELFRYQLLESGRPLFYSVGMDGVDDGGEVGESDARGDWVWPEPVDF